MCISVLTRLYFRVCQWKEEETGTKSKGKKERFPWEKSVGKKRGKCEGKQKRMADMTPAWKHM